MKIAVTGATGFLGGALTRTLLQAGHDVHVLVRQAAAGDLAMLPLTRHVGDVTRLDTLLPLCEGADWIIHAAGRLGQAGLRDADYWRSNVLGTQFLLEAARAGGRQPRVLHVSSAGVLGPKPAGGLARLDETAVESAPLAPSNPYERSKAAAERIALQAAAAGLPVILVRPEFVYGPGDRHVLGLFRAVQRRHFFFIGSGHNTCHPTFIDDCVAGMLAALQHGQPGDVFHVAGPRPVSFRELVYGIADALGVARPWLQMPRPLAAAAAAVLELGGRVGGLPVPLSRTGVAFFSEYRYASTAKARRQLGYLPRVELPEGLERTVAWYRAQGLLQAPPATLR